MLGWGYFEREIFSNVRLIVSVCGSIYRLIAWDRGEQSDDKGAFDLLQAVIVCKQK